jgi:2-keto-4-pentenoate hydratase/2-oxohepta-3-ene-1,7-dioic acid hydratase in catechol pathway
MCRSSRFFALGFALFLSASACGETPDSESSASTLAAQTPTIAPRAEGVVHYVRYEVGGETFYGILEGDLVRELEGEPYFDPPETGRTHALADVRLVAPVEPGIVLAVGFNYESHLGTLGQEEIPEFPELFAKLPTSIIGSGDPILMYPDSEDLHFETELVVVIGRTARNISPEQAPDHIFGVTAGNDVSERSWQTTDLQWLRAKASDSFGPVGPVVARGLNYGDLLLEGRLNGEVMQTERSSDLVRDLPTLVSYISRWVTLNPGDIIFTGTPGTTVAMQPGDVFEVEVEGVGVLRNEVVRAGDVRPGYD